MHRIVESKRVGMSTKSTKLINKSKELKAKKRILSPDNSPNLTKPSNKKPKSTKISAQDMEELKNLITSSTMVINSNIENATSTLENRISELSEHVNNEIKMLKTGFDEFKSSINSEIAAIKTQVATQSKRINISDDDFLRVKFASDLRLNGLAYKEGEKLSEIFNQIANEIGFSSHTEPDIQRKPIINKATGVKTMSPTILIHFASTHTKQMFYTQYIQKIPLDKDKRFIISENLTRSNAQLFKNARNLKLNKKIAQVFTEDGLEKIKFGKGKEHQTHTIRDAS